MYRIRPCSITNDLLFGNLTRAIRIEFKRAVYHVTSRGNTRQTIFLTKENFADFLLKLCLHVVINPLRAKRVKDPKEGKWSSYWATKGCIQGISSLTIDLILSQFDKEQKKALAFIKYLFSLG